MTMNPTDRLFLLILLWIYWVLSCNTYLLPAGRMPGIRSVCLESGHARPIYLVDSIPASYIFLANAKEQHHKRSCSLTTTPGEARSCQGLLCSEGSSLLQHLYDALKRPRSSSWAAGGNWVRFCPLKLASQRSSRLASVPLLSV